MKKILMIDDDPDVLETIQDLLTMQGFDVIGATNGMEGAQLARLRLPDLIICDINMPNFSGFETLDLVRQEPATTLIPFIFLTGDPERSRFRRGMESGADDFLAKPFNPGELLAAVTARLAKHEEIERRSEKKLDELRGNITMALPHELRTPLNGIMGLSSIFIDDYQTMKPKEILENGRNIHEAAFRLHRLIENFLVYAQIELVAADQRKIESLRRVELCPVADLITDAARSRATQRKREADCTVHCAPASLAICKEHLQKIADELTDNAFKFSPPGTPVQIIGVLEEKRFVLAFSDRGRGMSPDQIVSIGAHMQFERKFYEQQGAGLGLYIAKRLTELYGGEFAIESVPGQKTTVRVVFPLGKN